MSEDKTPLDFARAAVEELNAYHQTMLDHFGNLAKQDHDDLQAKIAHLKEVLRAILNSDMAQAAEDEGRVVPELEAARRML